MNATDRRDRERAIHQLIELRDAPFTNARHKGYIDEALAHLVVIPPGDSTRAAAIAGLVQLLAGELVTPEQAQTHLAAALAELQRDVRYLEVGSSDVPRGALNMAMEVVDGKVVVGFGTKVGWLSFAWNQAERLGAAFTGHAAKAKQQQEERDGEAPRTAGGIRDAEEANGQGTPHGQGPAARRRARDDDERQSER